jgi:hypothetical protein
VPTTSTAGGSTTVAAGGTTTTEALAPPSTPAVELACETVGFTPNSEDAASDVRATGLTCEEAEAFVRTAGEVTSSGGPEELDVAGYHCVRIAIAEEPLPTSTYRCTMGPKQVTFVRS